MVRKRHPSERTGQGVLVRLPSAGRRGVTRDRALFARTPVCGVAGLALAATVLAGCGASSHRSTGSEPPPRVTSVQSSAPPVAKAHRPKHSELKETYETGYTDQTNPLVP